jgi:hypothetical protein
MLEMSVVVRLSLEKLRCFEAKDSEKLSSREVFPRPPFA